jgi:hypothetical protein
MPSSQLCEHVNCRPVWRKNWIKDVLDPAINHYPAHSFYQFPTCDLKNRQIHSVSEPKASVTKNGKLNAEPADHLLLIIGSLRGNTKNAVPGSLDSCVSIPEATHLRSASASARNLIPILRQIRLIRLTCPWEEEEDTWPRQSGKVNHLSARRRKGDSGQCGAPQVCSGQVVGRNR